MRTLLRNISQLVRVSDNEARAKRGSDMNNLCIITDAAMLVDEQVMWVGSDADAESHIDGRTTVVDCGGRCILPGFVDSHTHIVFAGSRSHEFARRLQGVSYQQIASEGGGILSTVRAVRAATVDELTEQGRVLAHSACAHGTTTIEIKSGYALSLEGEVNMLTAIQRLRDEMPMHVHRTFLGAHDFPPEYAENRDEYVEHICRDMIPHVRDNNLAEFCDVFCDTGYFTVDQSRRILTAAQAAGMTAKVHADELSSFAAAELAAELGAISADHLLFISEEGISAMARSGTVATLLPGTAYTLSLPYAPARRLIEAGVTVALATDCNPGSCFTENMQGILSLGCTNMKMSVEESICAATLNGAAALGVSHERGSLEVGKAADFIVLDTDRYSDLVYHFGVNHVREVWIGGKRVTPTQ